MTASPQRAPDRSIEVYYYNLSTYGWVNHAYVGVQTIVLLFWLQGSHVYDAGLVGWLARLGVGNSSVAVETGIYPKPYSLTGSFTFHNHYLVHVFFFTQKIPLLHLLSFVT